MYVAKLFTAGLLLAIFQTVEIEGHIIGVKVTSGRAKIEHDDAVRALKH